MISIILVLVNIEVSKDSYIYDYRFLDMLDIHILVYIFDLHICMYYIFVYKLWLSCSYLEISNVLCVRMERIYYFVFSHVL